MHSNKTPAAPRIGNYDFPVTTFAEEERGEGVPAHTADKDVGRRIT